MQIKILELFFICISATLLLCGCKNSNEAITICDLAKNANEMNDTIVRIRATYLPDQIHGSVLVDKSCPDFVLNPMPLLSAKTEEFQKAVFGDIYHPMSPFTIDFSGKFEIGNEGKVIGNIEILEVHSYEKVENSVE